MLSILILTGCATNYYHVDEDSMLGRRDAEKHAAEDVSERLWFSGTFLSMGTAAFSGVALFSEYFSLFGGVPSISERTTCVVVPLLLASPAITLGFKSMRNPKIYPERLLGKSEQYIDAYTRTYRRQVKNRKSAAACLGCALGYAIGGGVSANIHDP